VHGVYYGCPVPPSLSRKDAEPQEPATRELCPRCWRPVSVCFCAHIVPLQTRTRVIILQHPKERDVGVGTVRIARLCLPNAVVRVGIDFSEDPVVQAALASGLSHVIYPGPNAQDVETVTPGEPRTLILVDGTWGQAQRLLKANPSLLQLPQLRFTPAEMSAYNPIRREPAAHCTATIEALAHVLGYLEGDRERFQAMLAPFYAMVESQLRYVASSTGSRHRMHSRRTNRPSRSPIPPALREHRADLLCVHGEANTWPRLAPVRHAAEIVHWVARRPATGEVFEAVIAPRHPLAPRTSSHIRIEDSALLAGETWASFVTRWQAFLRPSDVVVTWGHFPGNTLAMEGLLLPSPRFDAHAVACALLKKRTGTLEDCLPRMNLPAPEPCGLGRGGFRLAALCRFLDHILA
jgi:DTW domain-containing protein YfiP